MSGTPITTGATPEDVAKALDKGLGASNIQKRGLSFGKMIDGELAGSFNAVWAYCKGKDGEVEVKHNLGRVPEWCLLWSVIAPPSAATCAQAVAGAVKKDKWTATTCRMDVYCITGAIDECQLVFLVGGE